MKLKIDFVDWKFRYKKTEDDDIRVLEKCIQASFISFDKWLYESSSRYEDKYYLIFSRASVVIVTKSQYIFTHLGDSKAVLVRDGVVKYSTIDHTLLRQEELDRATKSCLVKVEEHVLKGALGGIRVRFTRAFAGYGHKSDLSLEIMERPLISKPDTFVLERSAGDQYIVIASAALWPVLSVDKVVEIINDCMMNGKLSTSGIVKMLLDKYLTHENASANISIIIVKL